MADGKKPPGLSWGRWKPQLKWLALGAVAIGLLAVAGWWYWRGGDERPIYKIHSINIAPGENRDENALAIQEFLAEEAPPDEYEFLGIIAQRLPAGRDQSTTTYVLFKRK